MLRELARSNTLISLCEDARFDELFVGRDHARFVDFVQKNLPNGGKFAVKYPDKDGNLYFIYPLATVTPVKSSLLRLKFEARPLLIKISPTSPSEKQIKKAKFPVFDLAKTDVFKTLKKEDEIAT